jgi:peptide/nickel transport system substrate-binding protein
MLGPADISTLAQTIGYEEFMRWDLEWTEAIPNIAESIEASDDGTTYTIHLRKGMKWSDGEPYTTDDLMFWYEDVFLNEDLPTAFPASMVVDGENPTVEQVDDHTLRITFPSANSLFLENLAHISGETMVGAPKHYLEQFHETYNPEAQQLAEESGFADWQELFAARNGTWENSERPTLYPWILEFAVGEGERVVAKRNPYYWKVDPDGRQLPYLDEVVCDVIEDEAVMLLKAQNGELDMQVYHINTLPNKPVLAQSREAGDYHFVDLISGDMNTVMISMNLTHNDDTLREIFQNKEFRIGLSHAINRQEIIDTVFQQQGEPAQTAPRPESDYYDEEFTKQYTEYDVDLANQYLDQAGYDDRDGDNFRLGPDGNRIRFSVDLAGGYLNHIDSMELVREYWREVGIDMQLSVMDRSLQNLRKDGNEHDVSVWDADAGLRDAVLNPKMVMPFNLGSRFAISWANWYAGGEPQEEPPEAPKRQMELYDELAATVDPDERVELFREIVRISKEEFYAIGISLPMGNYGIVRNNFHNVPDNMFDAWMYVKPGPSNPEQYFIED